MAILYVRDMPVLTTFIVYVDNDVTFHHFPCLRSFDTGAVVALTLSVTYRERRRT